MQKIAFLGFERIKSWLLACESPPLPSDANIACYHRAKRCNNGELSCGVKTSSFQTGFQVCGKLEAVQATSALLSHR